MPDAGSTIDLAMVAPFRVGALEIDPPRRRVSTGEMLEPRVMQVLVALTQAAGDTVSRDQLIKSCWAGRAVSDDAINRVIQRLRKLAETSGGAGFRIETVPRVGYCLIDELSAAKSMDTAQAKAPRMRRAILAALALVLLIGAGAWFGRFRLGLAEPARTAVAVEEFVIGPGVSHAFAQDVRAEVIDFLANDPFYAVSTAPPGGADHDANWRVRGRLTLNGDRTIAFAQLLQPGGDDAVFALRIDRATSQEKLARSLGLRIGRTAGCVMLTVTDPELTGGYVEAALPEMAASCVTWHDKTTTQAARMDAFRANVAALPRSAYFRARLAEMLGDRAAVPGAEAGNARAEGLRLVAQAIAIDPGQPHIPLARARLLPATDLVGREQQLRRALAARPSDCACEFGDYAAFLLSVGRISEARDFAARARERQPKNIPWMRLSGEAAAKAGDFDNAKAVLMQVAAYFPDPGSLDDSRLSLALSSADWPQARALVMRQPPGAGRDAWLKLIDALTSGDVVRVRAAGAPFVAAPHPAVPASRMTVVALTMANRASDAIAAAGRWLDRNPIDTSLLFEPSFASARRLPEFAALTSRRGLLLYWRATKTRPDFCKAPDAPPVCQSI